MSGIFSIRAQLMTLVIVAGTPLFGLIIFNVWRQNEREREDRLTEAHNYARGIANRIDDELGDYDGVLLALAPAVSVADVERNEELFVRVKATLPPKILNLQANAADGTPLGAASRQREPMPTGRNYLAKTLQREGFTADEPVRSSAAGRWSLMLARPLPKVEGKSPGVVGLTLDLIGLGDILKAADLPAGSLVTLLTSESVILARSVEAEKWVGHNSSDNPAVREAVTIREGISEQIPASGIRRVVAYATCRRADWTVYARVPSEAAFTAARKKLREAILLGGVSFALALGLAWVMANHITQPIRQLATDAATLGAGGRLQPSQVDTRSEVGKLASAFHQMLATVQERDSELRRLNHSLEHRVAELQTLFDLLPVGVGIAVDATGRDIRMNRALAQLLGLPPDQNASLTAPQNQARQNYTVWQNGRELTTGELPVQRAVAENAPVENFEHTIVRSDGSKVDVLLNALPLRDADGRPNGAVATFQDLTASKRNEAVRIQFERKLQQTQKLESLGVLAGGIAHDFNNILTSILGNASLAAALLPPSSPVSGNLESIKQGSMRAAELCRQMLAYSGKGHFVVEKVQLNRLVEETTQLLQLSISKQAVLRFHLQPDLPAIEADITQIRQVIMNLVINASDAIGKKSGVISVSTGLTRVDRAYLGGTIMAPDMPEGTYVSLEVADNGCGMSPETQARIFEPFFTTKFTGRGLGLAATQGIVRGHKGALKIYSELGRGTTFKLLFPRADGEMIAASPNSGAEAPWRGEGQVLVVDDEESIRSTLALMLRELGFEVSLAADGRAAVDAILAEPDRFSLVLMDLTMPHLDGEQTFTELRRLRVNVPVVLMSGFNQQEAVVHFTGKGLASFLQKPFQMEELTAVLQRVLGAQARK